MKRTMFVALALATFSYSPGVVAQTQEKPKQCYAMREASGDEGASVLMSFSGGNSVHLFWAPGLVPYKQMSAGGTFSEVARSMKDQGDHSVTSGSSGLSFPNGFGANYVDVVINGSILSGQVKNRDGRPFPIAGKCI